jgi:hypothetical protein
MMVEKSIAGGLDLLIDCESTGLITRDQMGNWD